MKVLAVITFALCLVLAIGCNNESSTFYASNSNVFTYSGRIDKSNTNEAILINSASSVSMSFKGDSCTVWLKNVSSNKEHNYFSVELNNEDIGRIKINGDSVIKFGFVGNPKITENRLTIFKSTEPSNGYIAFCGAEAKKMALTKPVTRKSIEFIGNSITCGMGNDTTLVSCNSALWFDQHNAYWAYGPIVARKLNVDFMLSSVSGIGIYRNWNDMGPIMPEVYENLYLNLDTTKRRNFKDTSPDIVSICLGTNDLSDGDGVNERQPFDIDKFTSNYITFVEKIYSYYPTTQVVLLSSPMLSGIKHQMLSKSLEDIKSHFSSKNIKPIEIFVFDEMVPRGCDFHPSIEDHKIMAEQLIPFYQRFLN